MFVTFFRNDNHCTVQHDKGIHARVQEHTHVFYHTFIYKIEMMLFFKYSFYIGKTENEIFLRNNDIFGILAMYTIDNIHK